MGTATNGVRPRFGKTEVLGFAFRDQVSDPAGHFHSAWLSLMAARIFLIGRTSNRGRMMTTSGTKIALVTGASRGLGRIIAIALTRKGVDLIGTYHSNKARPDFGSCHAPPAQPRGPGNARTAPHPRHELDRCPGRKTDTNQSSRRASAASQCVSTGVEGPANRSPAAVNTFVSLKAPSPKHFGVPLIQGVDQFRPNRELLLAPLSRSWGPICRSVSSAQAALSCPDRSWIGTLRVRVWGMLTHGGSSEGPSWGIGAWTKSRAVAMQGNRLNVRLSGG